MEQLVSIYRFIYSFKGRAFLKLIVLLATVAMFDAIGLVSIMPFALLVSSPEVVSSNAAFSQIKSFLSLTQEEMVLYSGVACLGFLYLASVLKVFSIKKQMSFVYEMEAQISKHVLDTLAFGESSKFEQSKDFDPKRYLNVEIPKIRDTVLMPFTQMMAHGVVAIVIFFMLVFLNPYIALAAILVFGLGYVVVFQGLKSRNREKGVTQLEASKAKFLTVEDVLVGLKEIKVYGLEPYFTRRYVSALNSFSRAASAAQVYAQIPKFFLEALIFGFIVTGILLIVTSEQENLLQHYLPVLVVFAMAGYRLMPTLQQVYYAVSMLKFSSSLMNEFLGFLAHLESLVDKSFVSSTGSDALPLGGKNIAVFDSVTFRYPKDQNAVIKSLSFTIQKNSLSVLAGPSGSGKSTVAELLLGLLKAESGAIHYQNRSNVDVAYVPQKIFLINDTVVRNIAVGDAEVDMSRLITSCKDAGIYDALISLPEGLETLLGDGAPLSGGQKQRIGIARALYRNPTLLVLDESTSALDGASEISLLKQLETLKKRMTIVAIAHRIESMKVADKVVVINNGRFETEGSFDDLVRDSSFFRKLIGTMNES